MKELSWRKNAWNDYISWQSEDNKTLKKINLLINDILRNPFEGIGKPEALRNKLSGLWSRRIDEYNRLVYLVEDAHIVIFSCKNHYE